MRHSWMEHAYSAQRKQQLCVQTVACMLAIAKTVLKGSIQFCSIKTWMAEWPEHSAWAANTIFRLQRWTSSSWWLIFKGERVIIPISLRRDMKEKIHSSHLGMEGCLWRARESIFGLVWLVKSSSLSRHVMYADHTKSSNKRSLWWLMICLKGHGKK